MVKVGVTINPAELRRLEDRLVALGRRVALREYRTALLIAARMVAKTARENLAPHRLSGRLAKSIKVRVQTRYREGQFVATVTNTRESFYGLFLETGTARQTGVQWLSRALADNEGRVIPRMAQFLRERLARLAA